MRCTLAVLGVCVSGVHGIRRQASPVLPCDWRLSDEAVVETDTVTLRVALKQRNVAEMRRLARDVSNPRSSLYGKHLSKSELEALTAPSGAHITAVKGWLEGHGATVERRGLGAILTASLPMDEAARMLETTFHVHVNDHTMQRAIRAADYVVPTALEDAVLSIYGLHGLPVPPRASRAAASAPGILNVTPAVIRETYGIAGVTPSGSVATRHAVAEFQKDQQMSMDDLEKFFKTYVPDAPEAASSVHKFIGDQGAGSKAGTEAALDIEYLMGVAPGVLTDFYYHKSNDFCSDLVQWTSEILDDDNPPMVHSVSYGFQGNVSSLGCSDIQVDNIDTNFAKLAARGVTIIFSSGDSGSGYRVNCNDDHIVSDIAVTAGTVLKKVPMIIPTATFCCAQADDGQAWTYSKGGLFGSCKIYSEVTATGPSSGSKTGGPAVVPSFVPKLYPEWPCSSPWVTSVGATRFQQQQADQPEMASDQFGSGGGFSEMFEAFEDQQAATAAYLAKAPGLPPTGSFPPNGRGTPDVSALGEGYQVLANGKLESVGGTSASAPAFAAMVSLLNEARASAGQAPMGYLNPWLYQNPHAFTDVTVGTNAIGRGNGPIAYGYNCTSGWDPVTGLGTPIFGEMLKAALAAGSVTSAVTV